MIAFTLETNKLKETALCGAERRYTIQDTLAVQQNENKKILSARHCVCLTNRWVSLDIGGRRLTFVA